MSGSETSRVKHYLNQVVFWTALTVLLAVLLKALEWAGQGAVPYP